MKTRTKKSSLNSLKSVLHRAISDGNFQHPLPKKGDTNVILAKIERDVRLGALACRVYPRMWTVDTYYSGSCGGARKSGFGPNRIHRIPPAMMHAWRRRELSNETNAFIHLVDQRIHVFCIRISVGYEHNHLFAHVEHRRNVQVDIFKSRDRRTKRSHKPRSCTVSENGALVDALLGCEHKHAQDRTRCMRRPSCR